MFNEGVFCTGWFSWPYHLLPLLPSPGPPCNCAHHPSCGSSQESPGESYLCSGLGGFLGGGYKAGGLELQNQTPGRRTQTWYQEGRVWMYSFSSPIPLLNLPASPLQGPSIPMSTMSINRTSAYTGLVVPTPLLPWPRLPVANVARPTPGQKWEIPRDPLLRPLGPFPGVHPIPLRTSKTSPG